jgi:hypothetical protein
LAGSKRKIGRVKIVMMIKMVKDKKVVFEYYRDGNLYYKTECGFKFPVPISEVGNATFLCSDKAILFMRWIRKQLNLIEKGETVAEEIEVVKS